MTEDQLRPSLAVEADRPRTASADEGLRFGIQFAETGTLGVLRIADSTWRGFGHRYTAAGSEPGIPFQYVWWYAFNGRFFTPDTRIDPPSPPHPPSLITSFLVTVL